jgi:N-acetylneuraminate synthase
MNQPTFIIAEAGVNHNGSVDLALQLVDAAAAAGADAVKFQTFRAEHLAVRSAPKAEYQKRETGSGQSQLEMLKALELSAEAHTHLMQRCAERGIEFMSSPFDEGSLALLVTLGVRRLKLGSGELTNAPLLLAAARSGLPVIISTGMATMDDVEAALGVLAYGMSGSMATPSRQAFKDAWATGETADRARQRTTVLHCTTEYPAPTDQSNVRAMVTMASQFGVNCGFSDHTVGDEAALAAVALGAVVIEKHFTLDRTMSGPNHKASLEPEGLARLVKGIRAVEAARGDGVKIPMAAERANTPIARKSLVAAKPIAKGERITAGHIAIKRPGTGRSPFDYWDVLGSVAARDYDTDQPFE